VSASRPFTPELMTRIRRLGAFDVSPCGRWLVATLDEISDDGKTYDTNLQRLDLHAPEKGFVALTSTARRKARPRFAPDGTLGFLAEPDPARRQGPPADEADRKRREGEKAEERRPMQLHLMPVDGGTPRCVTTFARGVADFRFRPDGRLVLICPVHPEARDLAHDRELKAAEKERKSTGVLHGNYPTRFWDHFHGPAHPHLVVAGADGSAARDLTPGWSLELFESTFDLSPDGRMAVVDVGRVDRELRQQRRLVLVDLDSGNRRDLTDDAIEHVAPRFSPDGRRVACLVMPQAPRVTGKLDLAVVEIATGERRVLTEKVDLWPDSPRWVDDARIAYTADDHGVHGVRVMDVASGAERVLTKAGHAAEVAVAPDRKSLYFLLDTATRPADVAHVPLDGGDARRLTDVNAEVLANVPLAAPTSHVVEGADGTPVQLYEYRPRDFDPSRKYPLLLWIHGGPLGSFLDQFHFRWNPHLYTEKGYVLILVNPRGSTGFGQKFIQDNNGDWGNRCFRDLMRVTDQWQEKPYVDASRTAALGASFGGYMVNWIAGHDHRFRCLVSHAGLYHLPAFWGTTDAGTWWELEFGGTPWQSGIYDEWSPHRFADEFRTPTLVVHGELDYRVPLGEGLQMFQALQKKRVPSKFLYFPDENHWILKPANMVHWNDTVLAWLEEWMAPARP